MQLFRKKKVNENTVAAAAEEGTKTAFAAENGSFRAEKPQDERQADKFNVKNLNLYYGKFQALKNISMDIKEREITAFIGPSGCGKSTFLKTLNRMNDLIPD